MNLDSLSVISKEVGKYLIEKSPSIFTGLGIAGAISSVPMAIDATVKAVRRVDDEIEKDSIIEGYSVPQEGVTLSKKEILKLVWPYYVPTAVTLLSTVGCIWFAHDISMRRNAALLSLYGLADNALKEYRAKTQEVLGEKKEKAIREAIVEDRLVKNPIQNSQIIITGKGNTKCFDSLSGRYFKSDMEAIRRLQNTFNMKVINQMYGTLNDFYRELGLEPVKMGDETGWSTDWGLLDISFTSKLAEDGEPCMVLEYEIGPKNI